MSELKNEVLASQASRHDSTMDSIGNEKEIDDELVATPTGSTASTVFQIYRRRHDSGHFLITPTIDPKRETFLPNRPHRKKKKARDKAETTSESDTCITTKSDPAAREYFLHFPCVAFHAPPRTLRVGNSKESPTFCIMHNSFLWRRWRIQIGKQLAEPGVIDGRGCVHLDHDFKQSTKEAERKSLKRRDTDLQGFPLRTWRMWGESGKEYHRVENERRRTKELEVQKPASKPKAVAVADEVVYLRWQSPFSSNTRRYSFKFRGIDFSWKGTGTVKESHFFRAFVRFNHLKLVARVAIDEDHEQPRKEAPAFREVCLAKFTCSVKANKAGVLEVFDNAVERFAAEYLTPSNDTILDETNDRERTTEPDTLYHLVISTAMCMIVGERQKRETIKEIIIMAAAEGGGNVN